MWDKPRCCGTSELHQCGSKFSECNTGSHANSLPLEGNQQPSLSQQLNLSFRFTLNLHNVSFSQSFTVRRRVMYEKTTHDMGMTSPKAAPKPGPAQSSTGLSKHCHTASHAGLGVAEPPSHNALGIYLTWDNTEYCNHLLTITSPADSLWDIRWTVVVSSIQWVSKHLSSLQLWKTDECQV